MKNNDRFKFRFWDKDLKAYMRCVNLDKVFDDKTVIAEQCTSVKDKNGKLIYEGDILATSNKDSQFDTWDKEQYGYTAVEWKQDFLCFNCTAWNFEPVGFDSVYSLDFVEVVGNIHENPELLER